MGVLSKIWKGVKKTVKKVARGIKKVVKKVGRAFGKLGIVGQIGLMFLMPYAMQGLGTFWKGFGGFANKLATSQGVGSQIFGKALSAVHTAGNMVGKVYSGITETISSAVDVVTGKGSFGDLTDSVKSIFSGPVDEAKSLFTGEKFAAYKEQALLEKQTLLKDTLAEATKKIEIPSIQDTLKPSSFGEKVTAQLDSSKIDLETMTGKIDDFSQQLTDKVVADKQQKTLTQRVLDYGQQQIANVGTAIQEFNLGEELTGGVKSGLKQTVARSIVDAPDPIYNTTNIAVPEFASANYADSNIFNEIDFAIQRNTGNPWAATSLANYDQIQAGLIQDETSWFHQANYARNLAYGTGR
jgi:hypothetical protein